MLLSYAELRAQGRCETCGGKEDVQTQVRTYVASEPTWQDRLNYRKDPHDSSTGGKRTEEHLYCKECLQEQEYATWLVMRSIRGGGGYGI